MDLVFQEWLKKLSWKEQTVLILGLRGTDANGSIDLKIIVRWLRHIVLKNAAPNKTFMKETNFRRIKEITDEYPIIFDMLPVHFFSHLMHTFEVIAYRHPDEKIRNKALEAYVDLCQYLHINPESKEEMDMRLRDEI